MRNDVSRLKEIYGITPGLATILMGENRSSNLYMKLIHKACKRVGIYSEHYTLSENDTEGELIDLIHSLNRNDTLHGILVQFPLPDHIDEKKIMQILSPAKDVDGFHPLNLGKMLIGIEDIVPCAPHAVIKVLEKYDADVCGKNVVVVGHSNGVGKPTAALLLNRNATVTMCHVYTKDLKKYTKEADILVTATGVKNLIKGNMVKEGAVVLDVGGDVDFENVSPKASLITPVPGGIGPITVSLLLEHTTRLAGRKEEYILK